MTTLSVSITGYGVLRDANHTVIFSIAIQQDSHSSWKVYRPYTAFQQLGQELNRMFIHVPQCPVLLLQPQHPALMEKAIAELSFWLLTLLQYNESGNTILQSRIFIDFVSTDADHIPPGLDHIQYQDMEQTNHHPPQNMGDLNMDDMFDANDGDDDYERDEDMDMFDGVEYQAQHGSKDSAFHDETILPTKKRELQDFQQLKVIGKGSFGKVVLVRDKETNIIYAMKILTKANIIKRNQVEHTKTERHVLGYVRHPFIVGLNFAFQTADKLYFVLDYCAGGELFFHLGKVSRFHEPRARFYAAEITLAIEYMHSLDIIYRDLKPENVLLDHQGHIRLTDFGLSKEGIQDNSSGANSFCGTPEYLAPEILNRSGHGRAVDWWSLGALLYEMLTGLPPFYCHDRDKLFDRIRRGALSFPKYLSPEAKDLLIKLLERDPNKRLGTGKSDAGEIKSHPFFRDIAWDKLARGELPVPWTPRFSSAIDTSQFDREFTEMPVQSPDAQMRLPQVMGNGNGSGMNIQRGNTSSASVQSHASDLFQGFTYTEDTQIHERYQRNRGL